MNHEPGKGGFCALQGRHALSAVIRAQQDTLEEYKVMTSDIWVSDHMSTDVVTCPEDTTLAEVMEELREHAFSCLVITRDEKPVGIVTERGLLSALPHLLHEENWEALTVDQFMSINPIMVDADATLVEAVSVMMNNQIRHAPVVNLQNEMVGILTQTDIVRGFYTQAIEEEDLRLRVQGGTEF